MMSLGHFISMSVNLSSSADHSSGEESSSLILEDTVWLAAILVAVLAELAGDLNI